MQPEVGTDRSPIADQLNGSGEATSPEITPSIAATAPGQLRVIKRNGTVVSYTDDKIAVAMTKAFLAAEGGTAAASSRIRERVSELTQVVTGVFKRRFPSGGTIHIEDIQDQVELALMRGRRAPDSRAATCFIGKSARGYAPSRRRSKARPSRCRKYRWSPRMASGIRWTSSACGRSSTKPARA